MRHPCSLLLVLLLFACSDDGTGSTATAGTPTTVPVTTVDPTDPTSTSSGSASETQGTNEQASASASSTTGESPTTDVSGSTSTGTGDPGTSTGEPGTGSTSTTTGGPLQPCQAKPPIQPPGDCAALGVTIEAPYEQWYTCYDLGVLPDVPTEWGGIIVEKDNPEILLAGGAGNTLDGKLYAVSIARDESCHIVGYQDVPTAVFSAAEYIDGGLSYHHDSQVLFLSRWPYNELGQLKPGSTATDKVIDLNTFAIDSSPGGFTFVPPGFPGAGQLKAVSWPNGKFYTVDIAPDGGGTYDITAATFHTTITGGPEAFVYISDANPEFPIDSLLVAEWSAGNIAAYEADSAGNPLPATRKLFIQGLQGAESAHVDALSGDFLFATYAGDERLIAVRGFTPQPQ